MKKVSKKKEVTYKFKIKEAYLLGFLETLIFSFFISIGNTVLIYQACGTKYNMKIMDMFLIQFPIFFAIFGCFIYVYIIYLSLKNGK